MSSQTITLALQPRGDPVKNLPEEIVVPRAGPASEIYQQVAARTGLSIHRVRVTRASDGQVVPNEKVQPIQETGLLNGSRIYVKDLGPQISWRTVFIVEYIGPLFIHPLLYFGRPYLYSNPSWGSFPPPSTLQTISLLLICVHYIKREVETLFVHRFSAATMPARNIFKNSFHYWILSGLFLGYFIYGPSSPTAGEVDPLFTFSGLALYTVGQLGNLSAHLTLRSLRSSGGKERGIPSGWAFNLVTCPNYMFEAMTWTGVCLVTKSWATLVFALVSIAQMAVWAKKKERRYRREFGDKYKNKRSSIIPGIY